jgi:hypothetical protein
MLHTGFLVPDLTMCAFPAELYTIHGRVVLVRLRLPMYSWPTRSHVGALEEEVHVIAFPVRPGGTPSSVLGENTALGPSNSGFGPLEYQYLYVLVQMHGNLLHSCYDQKKR